MARKLDYVLRLLLCVSLVFPCAAMASGARVDWKDLLSLKQVELEATLLAKRRFLWALDDATAERYYDVAHEMSVRASLKDGSLKLTDLRDDDRTIMSAKPIEKFPEAIPYWKDIEVLRKQLEAAEKEVFSNMVGSLIRIPGYVLPLEFDGSLVTEFLLVPYVGACIHSPAPPPNQIVHVTAHAPFANEGMFAPVWVDGVLATHTSKHDLSLVDGVAPVDVGYKIERASVEKYTK
jgi:hypothetical protein